MTVDKQDPGGRVFEAPVESATAKLEREAKVFVPSPDEALDEAPEAITAGEVLPHVDAYSNIRLDAKPTKGLKAFLMAFALLVVLLLGWEIYTVVSELLKTHWSLAVGFIALLACVVVLGASALRSYLWDPNNLGTLEKIHNRTDALRESREVGGAKSLLIELREFYADKPQAPFLKRCLDQLPDYSDDLEVIDHIDRVFLRPLDEEAKRRISKHGLQTATAIAISPWAVVDIALALWRNVKMIDDVAQIYGIRPSLKNRLKLLRSVGNKALFVGGSQAAINYGLKIFESVSSGAAGVGMGASIVAGFAQGLGAGIYTAKIGISAIEVTRPITLRATDKIKIADLAEPMISELKSMLGNQAEGSKA